MLHFRVLTSNFAFIHRLRQFSSSTGAFQQVKQSLKQVDPYSRIRVKCHCNLRIVPYDLLECPDSNLLKVTLSSDDYNLDVRVSGKEVSIDATGKDSKPSESPECLLEVPIKADLEVTNGGSGTTLSDLYSDEIRVSSAGDIQTKSLRGTVIDLQSTGNISCGGTTLAQSIRVAVCGKGNIVLDKLQGGELEAESDEGSISVNSSYSNSASFRTREGALVLKNVHKVCRVFSGGPGKLVLSGFNGTLQADVASREVSLQLSELVGKSAVIAQSAETMSLAVSDTVLENTQFEIKCGQLKVDPNTPELQQSISEYGSKANTLHVETTAVVDLKKMSWADTFGFNRMEK